MTYFFLNQNRVSFVYPWRQTAVKSLVTFLLVGPDNYSEPGSSSQKTHVLKYVLLKGHMKQVSPASHPSLSADSTCC